MCVNNIHVQISSKARSLTLVASEFRVDSRLLAPELNHRHRTIFENILKYQSKFEEHGLLPFQTEAVSNDDSRGIKYQKYKSAGISHTISSRMTIQTSAGKREAVIINEQVLYELVLAASAILSFNSAGMRKLN